MDFNEFYYNIVPGGLMLFLWSGIFYGKLPGFINNSELLKNATHLLSKEPTLIIAIAFIIAATIGFFLQTFSKLTRRVLKNRLRYDFERNILEAVKNEKIKNVSYYNSKDRKKIGDYSYRDIEKINRRLWYKNKHTLPDYYSNIAAFWGNNVVGLSLSIPMIFLSKWDGLSQVRFLICIVALVGLSIYFLILFKKDHFGILIDLDLDQDSGLSEKK